MGAFWQALTASRPGGGAIGGNSTPSGGATCCTSITPTVVAKSSSSAQGMSSAGAPPFSQYTLSGDDDALPGRLPAHVEHLLGEALRVFGRSDFSPSICSAKKSRPCMKAAIAQVAGV